MARTIYGPDGHAISVIGGTPLSTPQALQKLDQDEMFDQVEKRVKAQMTTLSAVWDPSRGKPKPTSVTYQTLRMMAQRNEWVRAIIRKRRNQIRGAGWSIVPQDEEDKSVGTEALCRKITNLFERPSMHGTRPNSRSNALFLGEILEDVLVIDSGCVEKEWTVDKWIAAMYPVDGATIAPNMDDRGGYHDDAYVQVVDGQITARFGIEDLMVVMDNPQTDVRFAGFGFSPLEYLIVSVSAELFASKYNASYFEKGSVPEGMINLGPEAAPEDVNAFRLYWMNEIMGRPWSIPILGGSKAEWIPWRATNQDMQYMEYQEWLLKKMCAIFQMSPKEMGLIDDVNRSTAGSLDEGETEAGVQPMLQLFADYFQVDIIGEHGLGVQEWVKFTWDEGEESQESILNKFSIMIPMGAATRAELRDAIGMEPGENAGLDEFLTSEDLVALPGSPEDLEAISPAATAEREQEENEAKLAQLQAGDSTATSAPEFGTPEAEAAKVAKVRDLPDPALLEHQQETEQMFPDASADLLAELGEILEVPVGV